VEKAADIKTEDWNEEDMEYGHAVNEISDLSFGGGREKESEDLH
jgi:hypothetical protein